MARFSSTSTWYRVHYYLHEVTPVEVEQFTLKFVRLADTHQKVVRKTDYESFFPTLEEACADLVNHFSERLESAEKRFKYEREEYDRALEAAERARSELSR